MFLGLHTLAAKVCTRPKNFVWLGSPDHFSLGSGDETRAVYEGLLWHSLVAQ